MLHQRQKERQILGRDTFLVKRENEIAAAGMNEKIRILDALGNALIGEQLPDVVTGEKGSKVFRHHVGVDGHCDPSCAFRVPGDRVQRPVIGNMGTSRKPIAGIRSPIRESVAPRPDHGVIPRPRSLAAPRQGEEHVFIGGGDGLDLTA